MSGAGCGAELLLERRAAAAAGGVGAPRLGGVRLPTERDVYEPALARLEAEGLAFDEVSIDLGPSPPRLPSGAAAPLGADAPATFLPTAPPSAA